MPERSALGLLIVLLAFISATPMAVGAPPRSPLVGIQDDYLSSAPPAEVGHRLDMIERTAAALTRVDVLWRDVAPTRPTNPEDPGDPAYDWSRIDTVVRGLARRDVDAILTAYSTPRWGSGVDAPAGSAVNPGLPRVADYARFMQALAERYSGRYAPPGGSRLPAVRLIEVWNEPNLERFLAPQWHEGRAVARDHYIKMLRAAYPRIKRVSPSATVLAGAAGPRSSTSTTGIGAYEWLRGIVASGAPFDALSTHVYPAVGPLKGTRGFPAWKTLPFALKLMDSHRRHRGKPLYVTETGYTTLPTPLRRVVFSEAEQAAFLRQITRTKALRSGRVPAVIWFNLQDNADWPGGLVRGDGSPKASWKAFRSVARTSGQLERRVASRRARSARQLLIDQRIGQTALRRAAVIDRALGSLSGSDIRPGGLLAESFDASVRISRGVALSGSRPLSRRVRFGRATRAKSVSPLGLAAQARVNLRISRAALRRVIALELRLERGLTGGDVKDGTIRQAAFASGTPPVVADASSSPVPATTTPRSPRLGAWAKVTDSQRVSQEALRRTQRLTRLLQRGLTTQEFRPGSLSRADLAG